MKKSLLIAFLFYSLLMYSQEESQYPDIVIDSYNTTTQKKDVFYGGKGSQNGLVVPLSYLLYQNDHFVSFPTGSYVVLGFTDNYIMDAPNQNDLFMEEVGGAGEYADIFVSSDNIDYTFLGKAGNGEVNEFDLATIAYKKNVKYLKIVGKDNKGASPGFDVRNIYGLPGANKMEEPIVLENVLFETNKSVLLPSSFASLDKLASQLEQNSLMKIEVRGHTDNVGNTSKNQTLSEQRAKAVLDYLVAKGIEANRLSNKGFGSSVPIASNDKEEGRQKNRRVEFLMAK
ncbi:OmpA family protein [Flavobacterium sp. 25HG05S-40]|uniref:OmpA family protein n=1 Tax=Flavobacterium sp. 25HG05S-40 TaxID=3458682 RepID=UPI004044394E